MLPSILPNDISNTRGKIQHPPLGDSPIDETWYIGGGITDLLEPPGYAEGI
jgi:hypothetical protein